MYQREGDLILNQEEEGEVDEEMPEEKELEGEENPEASDEDEM